MKALSIRQPWAWLIVNGHKNIENRSWKTLQRGPVLVHASKTMTRDDYEAARETLELASAFEPHQIELPSFEELELGGIVGRVEIVGCVHKSPSPWFFGDFGFVLEHAEPLPFRPYKGALGFFNVEDAA